MTEQSLADYRPLPRPSGGQSPPTTEEAFEAGARCGSLGFGIPDFADVTGAVGIRGGGTEVEAIKAARFRAACAGHKIGRRRAGLPPLLAWQRREEEAIARRAS